jgi:hypothetical protein
VQYASHVCHVTPVHRGDEVGLGDGVLATFIIPAPIGLVSGGAPALNLGFEARHVLFTVRLIGQAPDVFGEARYRLQVEGGLSFELG